MLKATERATGTAGMGRPSLGGTRRMPPKNDAPTYKQLGLNNKNEGIAAQQLAGLPDDIFELVVSGKPERRRAISQFRRSEQRRAAVAR